MLTICFGVLILMTTPMLPGLIWYQSKRKKEKVSHTEASGNKWLGEMYVCACRRTCVHACVRACVHAKHIWVKSHSLCENVANYHNNECRFVVKVIRMHGFYYLFGKTHHLELWVCKQTARMWLQFVWCRKYKQWIQDIMVGTGQNVLPYGMPDKQYQKEAVDI